MRSELLAQRRAEPVQGFGVPLLHVSREDRINPLRAAELLGAFDIGPTRTLQQDVEFGVIQIADRRGGRSRRQ